MAKTRYMGVEERDALYGGHHCDHCVLTFGGQNWFIYKVDRHLVYAHNGLDTVVINMANVNWDGYTSTAVKLLEDLYGPL